MSVAKSDSVLHRIVNDIMKDRNIEDYEYHIDGGGTGNADGYMGEIVFFHVLVNQHRLNFVLKAEKPHEYLKQIGSDILNNRELDMYTTVLPALEKFTTVKNWSELPTFIPKVWFAGKYSERVNIVLEDLKLQNFHNPQRGKPLDFSHMRILFETYGKWHGTSMAFRDQHPEKFCKLVDSWVDPRLKLIKNLGFVKQCRREFAVVQRMLTERKRFDLVKIYADLDDQMEEILLRKNVDQKDMMIISHGDNWGSNFMFKYKDIENSTPDRAYLIDFQLSRLDSPALDLSSTLYNMGDKKTFEKFDDLLSIYHKSLSNTLQSLGSNPDDLLTMDDLKRHWKKYGLFSVALVFGYLRVMLCDPDEAPDLAKMAENGIDFDGAFAFQMKRMETFWERALDIYIHYGEFVKQLST